MIQYVFAQLFRIKNRACGAAVQIGTAKENNNRDYARRSNMQSVLYRQFVRAVLENWVAELVPLTI